MDAVYSKTILNISTEGKDGMNSYTGSRIKKKH